MSDTILCSECDGTGYLTRYSATSKTHGELSMYYTPRQLKLCSCKTTRIGYSRINGSRDFGSILSDGMAIEIMSTRLGDSE